MPADRQLACEKGVRTDWEVAKPVGAEGLDCWPSAARIDAGPMKPTGPAAVCQEFRQSHLASLPESSAVYKASGGVVLMHSILQAEI